MAIDWTVSYFIVFLQVFAAIALFRLKSEHRFALRIFAALFLLNAGVTVLMGLPRESVLWLRADEGWITRSFRALDAPSGYLLLAFVAARSTHAWGRRAAWGLIAFGVAQALAELPFHRFMVDQEYLLRALPLYAGLGWGSYVLAAGRPWERWIALALVARGFYWGSAGVVDVLTEGFGDVAHIYVNRIGLVLLTGMCVLTSVRLLRRDEDPHPAMVVPVLLIGPVVTLLEEGVRSMLPPTDVFRHGTVAFLNLLTLGLVRPVITLLGLARDSIFPVAARALLTGAVAAAATLLVPPFRFTQDMPRVPFDDLPMEQAILYGFGLCIGLLAVVTLEARPAFRLQPMARAFLSGDEPPPVEVPVKPPPAKPLPSSPPPTRASARPARRAQWEDIMLALRGSCVSDAERANGEPHLAQRALAERARVDVRRVSEFADAVNATAAARLDAYVPDWRASSRGDPVLVKTYRGVIRGEPGVWVYYRLTPLGERLAEAIARRDAITPPRRDT